MTDLVNAAQSGDKRKTLVALRDILAKTIQTCDSGRDMASNSKRLMEVIAEIEAIDEEERKKKEVVQKKISKHDRLKAKNEKR